MEHPISQSAQVVVVPTEGLCTSCSSKHASPPWRRLSSWMQSKSACQVVPRLASAEALRFLAMLGASGKRSLPSGCLRMMILASCKL